MIDAIVEEFDAYLTAAERALVERAKEFGRLVVAPQAGRWEEERRQPLEALRAACAAGLASIELSPACGGQGLRFSAKLRAVEELAKYDFAFAFSLVNHHNATVRVAQAQPQVAARLVPRMLAGELIGGAAYTEPGHGSDLGQLATTARKVEGGWIIKGEKAWMTNGASADVMTLLAQTDAAARAGGIATFVIEADRPGFVRLPPYAVQAGHAIGAGGFRLEDYFAPDEALLDAPGAAFKRSLLGINGARAYVAAMCAGMLDAAIGQAVAAAAARQAFGQRVIDFQGLRWSLVDADTDLAALRLLAYRAARQIDQGANAEETAARAKKFAGDRAVVHLAACVQAMGADGLRCEHPLVRHLTAAKIACFTDGTTQMMNERLGKRLLHRLTPS